MPHAYCVACFAALHAGKCELANHLHLGLMMDYVSEVRLTINVDGPEGVVVGGGGEGEGGGGGEGGGWGGNGVRGGVGGHCGLQAPEINFHEVMGTICGMICVWNRMTALHWWAHF